MNENIAVVIVILGEEGVAYSLLIRDLNDIVICLQWFHTLNKMLNSHSQWHSHDSNILVEVCSSGEPPDDSRIDKDSVLIL